MKTTFDMSADQPIRRAALAAYAAVHCVGHFDASDLRT